MGKQKVTAFVSLSLCPIAQRLTVTGFGKTRADCESHRDRTDDAYQATFEFNGEIGRALYDWFQRCGVPNKQAIGLIRKFADVMLDDVFVEPSKRVTVKN